MSRVDLILNPSFGEGALDQVAQIHLFNPDKMNALTADMLAQLDAHLITLEANPDVRAVVLTSEGTGAFCTGADIADWGDMSPAEFARNWVRNGHRVFDRLARLGKPTLAVIDGYCFGGGLELAAACDLRVMTQGASLALPEAGIGIVPGWSGTQRLLRLMPEPMVKEMALFGHRIKADRAVAAGFALAAQNDARRTAAALLTRACGQSPRAVEITKSMIHAAQDEDRAAMIEALGSAAVAASDDRAEGVAAFLNKRRPDFSGA